MDYKANSGVWGTMFGVPFVVADNFLKLATGQQIKVLLYLLRCSGRNCSDEEISQNTGVSAAEAADAVLFWQQVNVLTPQMSAADAVPLMAQQNEPTSPAQAAAVPPAPSSAADPVTPRQRQNLNPSEISDIMKSSADISELFKVAESALGSLNHTQQNSLIWMHNYLGLKLEVIVVLIYYCVEIDKTSASYIEKIACSWAENDINDLNSAQNEVERLKCSREFSGIIMKMFEMEKSPTPKQSQFIEQWQKAGYSTELIKLAYENTLDNINKLSFDYVNKILLSWAEKGYTTTQQVREAEISFRKQRQSSQRQQSPDPDVEKYKAVINKF